MGVDDLSDFGGGGASCDSKKSFAANVRQYRRAKETQAMAIAELVGVGTKAISDYEVSRTEPAFDMIEKIANALEIPAAALFGIGAGFIPAGPRGKALHRINATLSRLNDAQLTRAASAKCLAADASLRRDQAL